MSNTTHGQSVTSMNEELVKNKLSSFVVYVTSVEEAEDIVDTAYENNYFKDRLKPCVSLLMFPTYIRVGKIEDDEHNECGSSVYGHNPGWFSGWGKTCCLTYAEFAIMKFLGNFNHGR